MSAAFPAIVPAAGSSRPADSQTFDADRDFDTSPLVVFYETTQACDLVCTHCRACAQTRRNPGELSPEQARALLDDLCRFPQPPLVVLTGGDPMKRPDLEALVAHGVGRGLSMALTPSATPLVTRDRLAALADAGLGRLAVSIDGSHAGSHDAMRGVAGSFVRSLEILNDASSYGLPLQVNTTVHPGNVDELPALADLVEEYGAVMWSVFFLVPVGRAAAASRLSAERCEEVFARIAAESARRPFLLKTTEAPHYRRFLLQGRKAARRRARDEGAGGGGRVDGSGGARAPWSGADGVEAATADVPDVAMLLARRGTNDGKGVAFIGHTGIVSPSGFLPLPCGRFPRDSVVDVYQRSPTFVALRDPDRLGGKCGVCEYRTVCGGSRARSFAVTGDPLAAEPDCAYLPPAWEGEASPLAVVPR